MITVRKSEERGHANHGWLDAYHTFSFAHYHDPDFVAFSALRVLNQDRIQAGQGFGTHPHADMEIVTYVLDGVLEHKDSMGNGGPIRPGDVQFMSAGSGVTHSEFNGSQTDEAHLLQMWVIPAERGTTPRYDQRRIFEDGETGLRLAVSPAGPIVIGQDAKLYVGRLDGEEQVALEPGRAAWLHVARGELTVNGTALGPGDGAAIRDETALQLNGNAELVLWDLP